MMLVAGVDSSTQSCKVEIVDAASGAAVRSGRAPHPEGTEVDPELWWQALGAALDDGGGLAGVGALSVAAQQHGMVLLGVDGHVLRPALLWNDTRSAAAATALTAEVGQTDFARRTGSVPVASFTITKLRWVRDAEPEIAARVAAVALPHDWLTWRLRGYGPAESSPLGPDLEELSTDRSDASGTGYWNPTTGGYDLELFERALGRPARVAAPGAPGSAVHAGTGPVPAGAQPAGPHPRDRPAVVLPRVLQPGESAGTLLPSLFGAGAAQQPVLLAAGAGDNAAAALGLGATTGDVVVSIGTSGTVFAVTDQPANDATGTVAGFADASGRFLPLTATLNAARVLTSVATVLDVDHDGFAALALQAPPGSDGVVLVPYFEGERTPNLPEATASFHGLTLHSTTRSNLARAATEGMLCGLADGLDALCSAGVQARRILLIGGAAQNPAVTAVAAQVFNLPVIVPAPGEYVALGAAAQAAWLLSGSRPQWRPATSAEPCPDFRPGIRRQYQAAASAKCHMV